MQSSFKGAVPSKNGDFCKNLKFPCKSKNIFIAEHFDKVFSQSDNRKCIKKAWKQQPYVYLHFSSKMAAIFLACLYF